MNRCSICKRLVRQNQYHVWGTCIKCRSRLPESLVKACQDPFTYALGLRDGTKLLFSEADIQGEWVKLKGIYAFSKDENAFIDITTHGQDYFKENVPFGKPYPRGIEVRITDIVWCADAPDGS